jgi:hypothetical protein
MNKSSDTIGNRTVDLPGCSAVLQPTAPPRAPRFLVMSHNKFVNYFLFIFDPHMSILAHLLNFAKRMMNSDCQNF